MVKNWEFRGGNGHQNRTEAKSRAVINAKPYGNMSID